MSRIYVFADESGDFNFSRHRSASRYFSVGTIIMRDNEPAALTAALTGLRRELAWRGVGLDDAFHATADTQVVRDHVLALLATNDLVVDVTLLEKSKAQPHVKENDAQFYQHAWFYHFQHLARRELAQGDELLVVASQLGTKKRRTAMRKAVESVVAQCAWRASHRVAFWPCASDPCLQATDYCLWAVARKWERDDDRAWSIIRANVRSEYDLWARGTMQYY